MTAAGIPETHAAGHALKAPASSYQFPSDIHILPGVLVQNTFYAGGWVVGHSRSETRFEEVVVMESPIRWETEMKRAIERAKKEDKPILMDFFNPG